MAHIAKDQESEQFKALTSNPNTLKILLHSLTKEYAMEGNQPEVSVDDLIELLIHVCTSLTNLICNDRVCQDLHTQFDMLGIMKDLLRKYFLTDALQVQNTIATKNINRMKQII